MLIGLLVGLIFVSSSIPNLRFWPSVEVDVAIRKAGHILVYFSLSVLIAFLAARRLPRPIAAALAIAIVVLIAIADEINQLTVVGREASLLDVAIDTAAAVVAALLFLRLSLGSARLPPGQS